MLELLKNLCMHNAPSGMEKVLRDTILSEISGYCDVKVDPSGNIIAFKKGRKRALKRVMIDAHMDEVGIIITSVTDDGFLRFDTVGGILPESLMCKRVIINNRIGVIGAKPIHQSTEQERKVIPKINSMYVDIGAQSAEEALQYAAPGDIGTFYGGFLKMGSSAVLSKALDDRFGCAALIELLKQESEYDFYATFTVGEELGCRGAKTAAFSVDPHYAIILEATTASDIHDTPEDKQVCRVKGGAVISFMDHSTLYEQSLYKTAFEIAAQNKIKAQTKSVVAGGNNAGAVSLSRNGVKTIALSLPCRYIHSSASVAAIDDMRQILKLADAMKDYFASLNNND